MCTHPAHVIKNIDDQNLATFWTIEFGGVMNKFLDKSFRKFFLKCFWTETKSFEQKTPVAAKKLQLQRFSEDFSSSRKNPRCPFSCIFKALGKH
tara:strand:+ start:201 stop:482 length:282 start_codon:yes stop_codon:yes gene_type:complete